MNNKYFWYEFKLFWLRFLIIGFIGYGLEVIYTGSAAFINYIIENGFQFNHLFSPALWFGHTSVFSIFLYGLGSIPYTFLYSPFKKIIPNKIGPVPFVGRIIRAIIYALFFMLIEFIVGFFFNYILKNVWWDYSNKWGNILGLTAFSMFWAWILIGWIGEEIHKRLIKIDDMLLNPGDNTKIQKKRAFVLKRKK